MVSALPLNHILTGDCIEILNALPERSVDMIFADPPYNLQLQQELYRPNQTRVDAVHDAWDHFESLQAYDAFTRAWLEACRRLMKDTATLWVIGTYHNIYRIGALMQELGYWFLNDCVWIKSNPMPNFRGVRFTNAHETLLWATKMKGARYTFNHHAMKALNGDLQMRSDWYLPICTGAERLKENGRKTHSTQKPQALLYRVVLAATNPGDVILDPFFGTGTTGAVAKLLGRQWIGIEREEHYARAAAERIEAIVPAPPEALADPYLRSRSLPRLPFGALLENGLLLPGQYLYFAGDVHRAALVRADGRLQMDGVIGSIHQMAATLANGSAANGWDAWYYQAKDGSLQPIDTLRQQLRQQRGEGALPLFSPD